MVHTDSWEEWKEKEVLVIGDAAQKVKELHGCPHWTYDQNSFPNALFMNQGIHTAGMHEEDVAYFEPFYLKNFIAAKSKKNIL